jgi:subtilisin family serine protease
MRKLMSGLLSIVCLISLFVLPMRAESANLPPAAGNSFLLTQQTQFIGNNYNVANWGLDRIDQRFRPLNGTYTYNNTGAGVNVYVFDNGINQFHQEFEGRASLAYNPLNDGFLWSACDDHGTHVAGIIGGKTFGVAKQATLHSIRVATCQWNQQEQRLQPVVSDEAVVQALDWVMLNHVKPAVVNMSFAKNLTFNNGIFVSTTQQAIEERIKALVNLGVTVVAGAGNVAIDASLFSPARVPQVITVGGSDIYDKRDPNSAYGNVIDIYAPGVFIVSASNASNSATAIKTGTSMSTAFVTGVVAQYLQSNPAATPAQVDQFIKQTATFGIIPDPYDGSPKSLLFTAQ